MILETLDLATTTILAAPLSPADTLPDFNTNASAPPGAEILQTIINWLMYIGYAAGIIGFLVGAIMLMIASFRGRQSDVGGGLFKVGIGVILLTSAIPLVRALM